MNKKHVLVVDDERNNLHTMEFILEAANYNVTVAVNGQDAMKKISEAKNPIDLIITDIRMPVLGGLELIDKINHLNINVPILVITGYGDKELVVELMRRGCAEYLDKPINYEELIKKISILFEKSERKQNFYGRKNEYAIKKY